MPTTKNRFLAHEAQNSDPASLYMPAGQIVQTLAPAALYVPPMHSVHIPTPVAVLYVPAPQIVHSTPSYEASCPTLQVQFSSRGLPTTEKVLVGHEIQFPAPADEYVFTSHDLHAAQASHDPTIAAFLYVPALQAVHSASAGPPPEAQDTENAA